MDRRTTPTNLLFSKIESTLLVNSTPSFRCNSVRCRFSNRDENVVRQRFGELNLYLLPGRANKFEDCSNTFIQFSDETNVLLDIKHRQRNIFLFVGWLRGWMDKKCRAWRGNVAGSILNEQRKVGENLASWNGWKQDSRSYLGSLGATCSNS